MSGGWCVQECMRGIWPGRVHPLAICVWDAFLRTGQMAALAECALQLLLVLNLCPNDANAGTGKTVTLVECALQLLGAYPCARILLCAPLVSHVQLG